MIAPRLFEPSPDEIEAFIAAHPLASVVTASSGMLRSTPLPLLLDRSGSEARVIGHFAATNPNLRDLTSGNEMLAVFSGPHFYVSPSWLRDRTQAPTWNYMVVELGLVVTEATIEPATVRGHIERLVGEAAFV